MVIKGSLNEGGESAPAPCWNQDITLLTLSQGGRVFTNSPILPVVVRPLLRLVSMHIHVHPHQKLHEWSLAIDADAVTADNLDELLLGVDGAADSIHPCTLSICTGGEEVRDHQQVDELGI